MSMNTIPEALDELRPARLLASMAGRIEAARGLVDGWRELATEAGAVGGQVLLDCADQLSEVLGEVDRL